MIPSGRYICIYYRIDVGYFILVLHMVADSVPDRLFCRRGEPSSTPILRDQGCNSTATATTAFTIPFLGLASRFSTPQFYVTKGGDNSLYLLGVAELVVEGWRPYTRLHFARSTQRITTPMNYPHEPFFYLLSYQELINLQRR
jgi:hypothetical protein